jgi:hypothetical protein
MCVGLAADGRLYPSGENLSAIDTYDLYVSNMADHSINRLTWYGDTTSADRYDRDKGLAYPTSANVVNGTDSWNSEIEYVADGVTGQAPRVPSHATIDSNNNVWCQDAAHGLLWKIYTQLPTPTFPIGGFSTYPATGDYYLSGGYSYGRNRNDPEVEYALLCSAATVSTQSDMNGDTLDPSAALQYLSSNPLASPATVRLYPNYRGPGKTYTVYNALTATGAEREYNSDGIGIGSLMSFGRTILDADFIHPAETNPSGYMFVSAASSFSKSYCDSLDGSFWDDRTFIGPASAFERTNTHVAQYVSGYDDLWTTHSFDINLGSFLYRWGKWIYNDFDDENPTSAFSTEHTNQGQTFSDVNYHFRIPNHLGNPTDVRVSGDRYNVSGYMVSYPNVYDRSGNAATDWFLGMNYVDVYERWPTPKFCVNECTSSIGDQFWGPCNTLGLSDIPEGLGNE